MLPTIATSKTSEMLQWRAGFWQFAHRGLGPVLAGVSDRSCDLAALQAQLPARQMVMAEQVHGASIAAVGGDVAATSIPGCDALATSMRGVALVIRTADCLPIIVWDPVQRVVAAAHAGWRGLAARLPMRLVSFLRQTYQSQPEDLWVGIGPAIRACCYDVGEEFMARFAPFVQQTDGRLTCDLVGCAVDHFRSSGVRPARLLDSGSCTACQSDRWYSVRREGEASGRLLSFILIRR